VGYVKNVWVNGDETKPLDQIRLNHNEDGTFLAAATADSAAGGVVALNTLTTSGRLSEAAIAAAIESATATKADSADVYTKADSDEQYSRSLLTLTEKATLSADFVAADYRYEGRRVSPRVALLTPPEALSADGSAVLCRSTATNLQPGFPITTGTVGVIGSGGALPTGWSHGSAPVVKEILEITEDSITVKLSPPASQTDYGSIRLPAFVAGAAVNVSMDIEITNQVAGSSIISMNPGWWDGSVGTDQIRVYYSDDSPRRVTFRLPDPGGSKQIRLVFTSEEASDQDPIVKISRVTVVAESEAGTDPTKQPPYFPTSTLAAANVVLDVAAGEYVLVADTDNGVRRARVTVASGGLSLNAALNGYFTVSACWVIPVDSYDERDCDAISLKDWESVRSLSSTASPFMAALATRRVSALPLDSARVGNAKRGIGVSRTRPGRYLFDVRPGEVASGDGVTQERAEITSSQPVPLNANVDVAFGVVIHEFPESPTSDYSLICQYRYTNNASGDSSGLSPEFSIVVKPKTATTATLDVRCRTDGGVAVLAGDGTPAGIVTTTPVSTEVNLGQKYDLYARIVFSDTGGGSLAFYLDGVQIYSGAVAVGYDRDTGPTFRFGSYSNDMDARRLIEFRQPEFGTADLSDRITRPLAW
jgi:hypothetical protein